MVFSGEQPDPAAGHAGHVTVGKVKRRLPAGHLRQEQRRTVECAGASRALRGGPRRPHLRQCRQAYGLLQHPHQGGANVSGAGRCDNPLVATAEKGLTEAIECLLEAGATQMFLTRTHDYIP